MPKIEPIKNEENDFLKNINFQNHTRLWFSVDFLGRIGILNKKEIDKLHKDKKDYLLVEVIKQEYLKDKKDKLKTVQTTTTINLLNDDFNTQKIKTISIDDIKKDYEETLFHIYVESTQSSKEEILSLVKDSNFLKVSTRKIEGNLLFLLIKNNIYDKVLEIEDNYWHKSVLFRKLSNLYDEKPETLMLAKGEYVELYFERETNLLKKFSLAKKVLAKSPKYEPALRATFYYYIESDNQEIDAFKKFYTENYEELKTSLSSSDFSRVSFVFFLKRKQFDMCNEILKKETQIQAPWNYLSDNINPYLQGILYYEQENYLDSLKYFKEAVENIGDTELIFGCHIYMFSIYLKLKDTLGINNTLSEIFTQIESVSMNDYFVFVMELPTKVFFLQEIQYAIKNNISDKNRLIGIYIFIKFLREEEIVLSKNDKKEIKELLDEMKNLTKETLFDLYVMAQGFNIIGQYNNSVLYKLKYTLAGGKEWIYTEIEKCDEDFLYNYAKTIEKETSKPYDSDVRIERYFKEMFSKDIEELFNKKEYKTISDIYSLLKDKALKLFFSPEELVDEYFFVDRRFEVAYSLNEIGKNKEAQKVYESIEDQGSSVLNNLALIYEEEGNIKKAEEAIIKAFKLTDGNHQQINKNKERILSAKKSNTIKKDKTEPIQKPKLKWSDVEIKFTDENNVEIFINGKLKNKGDYETFGFKKPNNISWEILRILSYTKTKIQIDKEFYLTPENMFSKEAFSKSKDKKNLFQTYKSALSKVLCNYFNISDEPIPYDKTLMGYNPLLKITPEKELRNLEIQDTHATQYLTDI